MGIFFHSQYKKQQDPFIAIHFDKHIILKIPINIGITIPYS